MRTSLRSSKGSSVERGGKCMAAYSRNTRSRRPSTWQRGQSTRMLENLLRCERDCLSHPNPHSLRSCVLRSARMGNRAAMVVIDVSMTGRKRRRPDSSSASDSSAPSDRRRLMKSTSTIESLAMIPASVTAPNRLNNVNTCPSSRWIVTRLRSASASFCVATLLWRQTHPFLLSGIHLPKHVSRLPVMREDHAHRGRRDEKTSL